MLLHVLRGCYGYLARTILTYAKPQRWYTNFYSTFSRTAFVESDPTKVGETDTRQPSLCNKVTCQLMEPVSRKHTSKVGLGHFIPQYRWIKKRPREEAIWISTPTNSFVFYSWSHLHIDLAHDATVGESCMGNKKFPTHTQDLSMVMSIYERESGSTYPCRSLSRKR